MHNTPGLNTSRPTTKVPPSGARGLDDCRQFVLNCSKYAEGSIYWKANNCDRLWSGCIHTYGKIKK